MSSVSDLDHTRTIRLDPSDVHEFATSRGMKDAQALDELSEMAHKRIVNRIKEKLKADELTLKSVDHTPYHGMGTSTGKHDAYARAAVEQRMELEGRVRSLRPDATVKGGVRIREVSGRSIVDENQMALGRGSGGPVGDARLGLQDLRQLVNQQAHAVSKPDLMVQEGAKAVTRANNYAGRLGRPLDGKLVEVSEAIMKVRNDTKAINEILSDAGMNRNTYRQALRQAVGEANDFVNRAAGP